MSVHGASGFLLQPGGRAGWRQGVGAYEEYTWEGPTSALVTFLSSGLPGGFIDYSREYDGELTIVRASYSTGQVDGGIGTPETDGLLDTVWEMDGNDLEKSLWEVPAVLADTGGMSFADLAAVRDKVERILNGEEIEAFSEASLNALVARLARGQEAFTVSQYVLRKRLTLRPNATILPAYTNIGRVFNSTAIASAEPTLATTNLIGASGLSAIKWLKRTPRVAQTTSGLWEMEQEYWGADEWDSWLYPTAS